MFQIFRYLLRIVGIGLLLGYFIACGVVLGARYWVFPNIDNWRPQIVEYLSSEFGVQVEAGHIAADWSGLNPHIALKDVTLSAASTVSTASTASTAATAAGQPGALHIPQLDARLDWRSLIQGRAVFANLDASGVSLDLRRDTEGRLHALGHIFDLDAPASSDDLLGEFFAWLSTQTRIALGNATLRWTDDFRAAPPLQLDHITLAYQNHDGVHGLSFSAMPPAGLGAGVTAIGRITALDDSRSVPQEGLNLSLPDMDAQLYVSVDQFRPGAWAPWLDLPATITASQVSGKARLDVDDGKLEALTTDLQLDDGNFHPGHGVQLAARSLDLYLDGPALDYVRLLAPGSHVASSHEEGVAPGQEDTPPHEVSVVAEAGSAPSGLQAGDLPATQAGLSYRIRTSDLQLMADYVFSHPLPLGNIAARGMVERVQGTGLHISAQEAFLANADGRLSLHGSWQQGGASAAGLIDVNGLIDHARLASIAGYLPERVNAHAGNWLRHGLLAGELHQAPLVLRGDLVHFPFQDNPQAGDFSIAGAYDGGIIDYLPAEHGKPGWPRLEAMRGTASLHRADLTLTADEAITMPAPGKAIQLRAVQARIANLEHEPVLEVKGNTSADAEAYLALMTGSPLGGMLGHVFDQASASGQWQVPLALKIPLTHGEDTEVDGAIRFAGNTVKLTPEAPALSQTQGELAFSHHAALAKDIKGRFLGGPMTITGQVGEPGQSLRMQGQLSADALAQYAGVKGLRRLTGHAPYTAVLERSRSHDFGLTVTSDLKGLAADLPEPLGKSAGAVVPLKAVWKRGGQVGLHSLSIALGDNIQAQLLHRDPTGKPQQGAEQDPFFFAGALGVNEPVRLPDAGINLEVRYPTIAIDTWRQIRDELGEPLSSAPSSQETQGGQAGVPAARPESGGLFPPVTQLRLQARTATFHSMTLDKATVTAQRPAAGQWRVDVSSTQTAGTVRWTEKGGKVKGAVDAAFDRLDLGSVDQADAKAAGQGQQAHDEADKATEGDNPLALSDALDLPAVNLHIQHLRLYGHPVGELSLTGVNESHGQVWRLEAFRLDSPHAEMNGSGRWRLSGPQRGLTLDAHARIDNLGDYLKTAGYPGVFINSNGTADAQIEWHNMPWSFSRSDLDGTIRFDLAKGRFGNLNSHSAKLLELLSLQSLKRLARLDVNPAGLTREGFPFDTLRGTVTAHQGMLNTNDYRVVGPAGTIVLEGSSNLIDEQLDLQAVVIPNLDISGATIAAGIVINPIIGVGAFLAQWLLQAPLSQAMASQYHITGDWNSPDIQDITPPLATKRPQKPAEPTP